VNEEGLDCTAGYAWPDVFPRQAGHASCPSDRMQTMTRQLSQTSVAARNARLELLLVIGASAGLAVAAGLGVMLALFARTARPAAEVVGPQAGGTLLICGGGGIPDDVRRRFCQRAGGANARIVVIPAHHVEWGSESARQYLGAWAPFGAASVELLSVERRELAAAPDVAAPLERATGVWLGGGDQNWLTAVYRDTEISRRLQAVVTRGGVIGGSSAGAAAMPRVMIASGASEAIESTGLGLWPEAVIDQHFLRRNRLQRFVTTLSAHPELIGFGVDEQTALEVELRRGRLEVLGRSYVLACVPARGEKPERLEVLKHGDRTSLDSLREHDSPISSPLDLEWLADAE